MLRLLRSLIGPKRSLEAEAATPPAAPALTVSSPGSTDFNVAAHLVDASGFPMMDWDAARRWVDALAGEAAKAQAWSACELAWLEHLRAALGPDYRLRRQGSAIVLSTLEPNVADAALAFIDTTLKRIVRLLDGVAQVSEWGHDILLVFDDHDRYYRYVAHHYPEAGEFAGSSGIFIHAGCSHFATVKSDLSTIEPVIAHELTHGCVAHLSIPAWVNEGLAVNTERVLCPAPPARSTPQQMHGRHCNFWGHEEIQQFWSGKSFLRPDDGNELSYDLARILVEQFARDWARFRPFVVAASLDDGGAAAAAQHLGLDLGEVIAALLEKEPSPRWAPDPQAWRDAPERGAFGPRTR